MLRSTFALRHAPAAKEGSRLRGTPDPVAGRGKRPRDVSGPRTAFAHFRSAVTLAANANNEESAVVERTATFLLYFIFRLFSPKRPAKDLESFHLIGGRVFCSFRFSENKNKKQKRIIIIRDDLP